MGYQILCDGYILDDPRDDDLTVLNPKCSLEVNTVGGASFSIVNSHPYYEKLQKKRSIFEIRQNGEAIFRGRMSEDTNDFYNTKNVDLEGVLSFLNDSVVRPFSFPDDFLDDDEYITAAASGNVVEFFLKFLIDNHNAQSDEFQRFRLGRVTVEDKNNYITRSDTDYMSTWEAVKTKLFESDLGGYLCIRYEDDGNYIDYLKDFEETNTQAIEYGENLLDLSTTSDSSETYSAVLPLGMKRNEIDKESKDESRLTIAGLPDGNITADIVKSGDLIYSKSARERFGFIVAPVDETTWEDVSEADNLQAKAADFLQNKGVKLSNTVTIKAVDLNFSDEQIESFRMYRYIPLRSAPHGQDNAMKLTKLDLDIHNPQNTKLDLGDTQLSLTDINAGAKKHAESRIESAKVEIRADVQKALENQKSEVLDECEELYTSKFEQYSNSITLEISGSLGSKAAITLTAGGNQIKDEIDLSRVRKAFADDNTSVEISGGLVTFNAGTLIINSNNFKVNANGDLSATNADISGVVTTSSTAYMAKLTSGGLGLYYNDELCGTVNTKYWSGASTPGISLRIEEAGKYIMFSHPSDAGSGYDVDYYLNYGWSSNYDEKHIFQTSARFLGDAYFAGYTRIRSLRLFGSDGEYLVGIGSNGQLTVSKL